jgi:hypothetical protein
MQLKALIADPSPTLPLLEVLQDDESEYVRRSVANHLNDIAKDHPACSRQWVEPASRLAPSRERRALLAHASRTLVKRGDPGMLKLWGLGRRLARRGHRARHRHSASRWATHVTLRVVAAFDRARTQKLAIDYAVHHVKASGATSPKVFKGWVVDLAPREIELRLVEAALDAAGDDAALPPGPSCRGCDGQWAGRCHHVVSPIGGQVLNGWFFHNLSRTGQTPRRHIVKKFPIQDLTPGDCEPGGYQVTGWPGSKGQTSVPGRSRSCSASCWGVPVKAPNVP